MLVSRFNRFFEYAPQWLLPYRWWVLTLFLATTSIMTYGMLQHFKMDMSLESWFQDDAPIKKSLDEFRGQFGSDDGIYIVYKPKDGDVFSKNALTTLQMLHEELDNRRLNLNEAGERLSDDKPNLLSRIEQIDSLYNARYQIADGDTLISKKLIGREFPTTQEEREQRRAIALSQSNFELAFFSKDFSYGGIRIKTDFGAVPISNELTKSIGSTDNLLAEDDFAFGLEEDVQLSFDASVEIEAIEYASMQMDEYLNFMTELRAITEQPKYQDFGFHYTGNAPVMEFAMNNMIEASFLLLVMVAMVVILLWVLFHSFSAVLWSILVIAASGFWTIGIGSWMGVTFSTMVVLSFMLVLAVGIADCVHVLSAYTLFRQENHDHHRAMALAYRKTGVPILLTTITTMAGMLALTLSDIPQIQVFGVTSALSVCFAFLLAVFVLPVLLDFWPPYSKTKTSKIKAEKSNNTMLHRLLCKIPGFTQRYSKTIVLSYFFIFALLAYGASQVKVDSNIAELAKEGSDIQVTFDIVDSQMMGGQNMEIFLDFGKSDALKDPRVLQSIEALQRHAEQQYSTHVVKTFSLADYVKDTHKVMKEGQDNFYTIPEDSRLTAQLLYLFNNANPVDRRNLVSDDYSKSHIALHLRNAGTFEYTAFFDEVQNDIERIFSPLRAEYPDMQLQVTGSLTLMMELIDHIAWTQIKSFSLALLTITAIMILTLGSLQAGIISMLPNLLPAIFTFGIMGLLDIPLDTDTLVIAPIIIGIAVDDTIHFLAHYKDAWFEHGDVGIALNNTVKEVGQAVAFTTLILGIGFSVLAFSDYLGLAKPGVFGSAAIFIALSADLLFLPALIQWLKPDLGRARYLNNTKLETAAE